MSDCRIEDCSTEVSLGWKGFGINNRDREFYTFNLNYVRDFLCKSIKGDRVAALNRYFESKRSDEILNTL